MNHDPDASMDLQLLQLERELFSLTPVETPRHLASRIDRQVLEPMGIGRPVVAPSKIVPFQWRKIVVPAAAAVVVVSALNHLDSPEQKLAGGVSSKAGFRSPNLASASLLQSSNTSNGYVLRTEPVLISPGTWQAMKHHYYIQPGAGIISPGYNAPRRSSNIAPVVFH